MRPGSIVRTSRVRVYALVGVECILRAFLHHPSVHKHLAVQKQTGEVHSGLMHDTRELF
jgi:hypothetical protein